jgi:hypothetical protein
MESSMEAAATPSLVATWWRLEPRVDAWVSAGAFAVGLCAVLVLLL